MTDDWTAKFYDGTAAAGMSAELRSKLAARGIDPDAAAAKDAEIFEMNRQLAERLRIAREQTAAQPWNTADSWTAPPRTIRLTRADEIPHRRVTWTWADRLPHGSLAIIAGREGLGKSSIVCDLAAQLSRGDLPGEHHGTPRAVIFLASEDSWSMTIGPRLEAAGADMSRIYRADVAENEDRISLPTDVEALKVQVRSTSAVMVVLDPIVTLVDDELDPHKDRDVRRALEPLSDLAETTGAVVLGVAHHGKRSSTDALNLVLGSRAWTAVPRAVLAVVRDQDSEDNVCILAQAKSNLGRMDLPGLTYRMAPSTVVTPEGDATVGRVTWLGEVDGDLTGYLRDREDGESREDKREAAEWLQHYLGDPSRGMQSPVDELYRAGSAAGFSRDQLKRAKRRAGVVSEKATGTQHGGWVWRLLEPREQESKG